MTDRDADATGSEHFLVTGASGALGAWTVKALLDQSVDVTALCSSADDRCLRLIVGAEHLTTVRRIDANVLARDDLREAMNGITHVVHTDPELAEARDAECVHIARASITRLDDALSAAHALGVAGVAFDSSMSAFPSSVNAVGPSEQPAPSSARGCVHLAREMVAARWGITHGTPSTGLRVGAVYGAGYDEGPAGLVARAVAAAIENEPHLLDDQPQVDFQYVADVAAAMCSAARTSRGHRMLNLSGSPTSTAHFQRLLTSLTGAANVGVGVLGVSPRIAQAVSAANGFGQLPTDLEQGLRATIELIRWAPRDLATGTAHPVD